MLNFWDLVSISELGVVLSPIYFYFQTTDPKHIIAILGTIVTAAIVESSKIYLFPFWSRPAGARGCDLLTIDGSAENKPGFPSGHSAMIAYFGAFYGLWNSPYFLMYVAAIAASRYFKRCHSIPQIVAGLILGVVLGIGAHYFVRPHKA